MPILRDPSLASLLREWFRSLLRLTAVKSSSKQTILAANRNLMGIRTSRFQGYILACVSRGYGVAGAGRNKQFSFTGRERMTVTTPNSSDLSHLEAFEVQSPKFFTILRVFAVKTGFAPFTAKTRKREKSPRGFLVCRYPASWARRITDFGN